MKRALAYLVPVGILALGLLGAFAMILTRPPVKTEVPEPHRPVVRVVVAEPKTVTLEVHSEGTVQAPRTTTLVSEVSGRIVWVADALAAGGFFEEGDVLIRIDSTDYRLALEQARARVAQARLRLAQERAAARVARREWSELTEEERENPLATHELQLAEAEAALAAAEAGVAQAERDLARTEIRAPFAGRVLSKQADIGQFVARGTPLATVYAVDRAEVRLPIADRELAYVDLPLAHRGERESGPHPEVRLEATFAGRRYSWRGRIVRTEGQIDPRTRMVYAVAEIDDPYGLKGDPAAPPLAVGMFVEATIAGRTVPNVFTLPRAALRGDDIVYVVDDTGTLRFRRVEVLRIEGDRVLLSGGLEPGERVCVSLLDTVADGMAVHAVLAQEDGEPTS
ncbi:MAG: efflux RND transporter periplasmic adaptor subunit [Acidobacteria bacterium]|nr:MAG: efflux RND transporter periplasmic adaptor subunit [Acidobacteriota bacterium]